MPEQFGFALFGCGRIGTVHFKNLIRNQQVDLLWLVEADVKRAHTLLEDYRLKDKIKVASLEEAETVYSDSKVTAVMVCTPSFTHTELVIKTLKAGKHVFCEKPLAPTVEEVSQCYQVAKHEGVKLFCAFQRRWDPGLREVHDEIRAGKIGKPRMIKSVSRDPPGMMSKEYLLNSGGIFFDSAVHDIDMVCWLAGEQPTSVQAVGSATSDLYRECADHDCTVVTLRFPGGAIGTIEVTRDANIGYDQRVEVLGTEGLLQNENHRDKSVIKSTLSGERRAPIIPHFVERYAQSYSLELEHFCDVLQGITDVEVSEESTVMVQRIVEACKQSVATSVLVQLY